jgi:valyl-tRNA synthetase
MPTQKLTTEILTAAIEGFESQKRRIDAQIAEIRAVLPGGRTEPAATKEVPKGKRRKLSAAARKRISDAQRKRWAASKDASQPAAASNSPKRKRKLSAAGRRAISAATQKRWAAFHAAKAVAKPAVAKKRAAKKAAAKKSAVKAPLKVAAKKTASKKPQKKTESGPAAPPVGAA